MDVFERSSSSNDFCEATSGNFGEEELSRNERRRVQVYKADERRYGDTFISNRSCIRRRNRDYSVRCVKGT